MTTTACLPAPVPPAAVPVTVVPASPAAAGPVERLLRDRVALVRDLAEGRFLASTARAMLITIVAGAALFGAAIGTYRGGVQIAYAAVKLPIVLLFTAAIAAPALTAFNLALDRPGVLRRDLALSLCALALGALTLAAEAPLVLVARALDAEYHQTTLLVVGCCALAGLISLTFLVRGLRLARGTGALTAASLLCAVMMVVGAQAAWTLRPYLVRPRATEVPFVRDLDGNILDAVADTMRSVQGLYARDHAPLPDEVEAGGEAE